MIQYLFDNLLMAVVVILILVVLGFYFLPDTAKHLVGYAVASAKPLALSGITLAKKLIGQMIGLVH